MLIAELKIGASFSLHRCHEFGIDPKELLQAAINDLGCQRFRLMSYWNIHEPTQGTYDFTQLDWQFDLLAQHSSKASLCLGKRQPRWPECHIPHWAINLPTEQWRQALYTYINEVVNRYKGNPALESWQLENEALLKSFGVCPDGDYSHERLRHEYDLVKSIDDQHPVIMTLSDSWGIPWRKPKPDMYAMSLYRTTINKNGQYITSKRGPAFYRWRAGFIRTLKRRPVFIHELQCEPWLSKPITEVPVSEQLRLFDSKTLRQNVLFAKRAGLKPIDLWGLEWWYWLRKKHHDPSLWDAASQIMG